MLSRRSALLLFSAGSAAALAGCAAPAPTASSASDTLDAAGFAELVARPGTVVLDVRTPSEFAQGHLKGATNVDVNASDFGARIGTLDKAATYAVYCHSGNRSAVALKKMKDAGFAHVQHLAGGITAWQAAGKPVVA